MGFTPITTNLDIMAGLTGVKDNNYGLTKAQMLAKFDEGSNLLKSNINNLIDELEAETGAANIGCLTSYGGNVSVALDTIFAAGSGTVPPDDAITTPKIQDLAVTEAKLAEAVATKLNAIKVKSGKIIANYTAGVTGVTINTPSVGETLNAEQVFDIGFTPTAVLVFSLQSVKGSSDYDVFGFNTGNTRHYSSYLGITCYGGMAVTDDPMNIQKMSVSYFDYDVVTIVENGFKTHRVERPRTDGDWYKIGANGTFYYIAIG